MTEGERRLVPSPEGRRRMDTGKRLAHRAVPQQVHVIDAVGRSDHARDQRRDLQPGG